MRREHPAATGPVPAGGRIQSQAPGVVRVDITPSWQAVTFAVLRRTGLDAKTCDEFQRMANMCDAINHLQRAGVLNETALALAVDTTKEGRFFDGRTGPPKEKTPASELTSVS